MMSGCWYNRGLLALLILIRMLHHSYGDNLELLSGTLRTYQKAACDEEVMTLKCPRGTSISIQLAQYGKSAPSQSLCATELAQYTPTIVEIVGNNSTCLWPNALQTVVEACQKKRQCKFHTSPKVFGGDPCPGIRKYVEVAYRCRPYEFRSKAVCENDMLQMSCNPHSRIAIYSASFGRTEYESIQCPQLQGVPEETCLVSYATEAVMQMCHGKRRCTLSADSSTFGSPCRPESRMYLKVVYTCVPRKVLKERYEELPEEDETQHEGHMASETDDYDSDPGEDNWYKESAAIPPAPKVAAGPAKPSENSSGAGPVLMGPSGMGPEQDGSWQVTRGPHGASDSRPTSDLMDSLYLYLAISVGGALVVIMCVGAAHCALRRHYRRRDAKTPDISATTDLPNGFGDNISEVDGDIDMTTALPIAAVNSSLKPERVAAFAEGLPPKAHYAPRAVSNAAFVSNMYGPSDEYVVSMATLPRIVEGGTLRRAGPPHQQQMQQPTDVVVSPRSLNRCSNAQYYYG